MILWALATNRKANTRSKVGSGITFITTHTVGCVPPWQSALPPIGSFTPTFHLSARNLPSSLSALIITGHATGTDGSTERQVFERFVKSFAFSLLCFFIWGWMSLARARHFTHEFSWMEALWIAYNAVFAGLFLIRTRPVVVSLNPIHWLVALLASFSGLFFVTTPGDGLRVGILPDLLILLGLVGSGTTAVALRRNYDFLPALRNVSTDWFYRFVRHPMYTFSILIRLGYLAKHPTAYNLVVFLVLIVLYDRRAVFEEQILAGDPRYRDYARQVRFRFIPGVY